MGTGGTKSQPALGFLTVVEHEQQGLFGGYLLLNPAGRPLEFHCTAPIKANRAQQILYGTTLEPYLYGEQIGRTLVNKGTLEPLVVYTDLPAVLSVRDHIKSPTALVLNSEEVEAGSKVTQRYRVDSDHSDTLHSPTFKIGRNRLTVAVSHPKDREEIETRVKAVQESLDLSEPFARIREAIEEARGAGK